MNSNFVGCSTGIRQAWLPSGSVDEICDVAVAVRDIGPVGHEPAGIYILCVAAHRRQPGL